MLSSIAKRAALVLLGAVLAVLLAWGYLTYVQLTTGAAKAVAVWDYMMTTPNGAEAPRSELLDRMIADHLEAAK